MGVRHPFWRETSGLFVRLSGNFFLAIDLRSLYVSSGYSANIILNIFLSIDLRSLYVSSVYSAKIFLTIDLSFLYTSLLSGYSANTSWSLIYAIYHPAIRQIDSWLYGSPGYSGHWCYIFTRLFDKQFPGHWFTVSVHAREHVTFDCRPTGSGSFPSLDNSCFKMLIP